MSAKQITKIDSQSVFLDKVNEYNEKHVNLQIKSIDGYALNNFLSMYEHLEKLFEYFNIGVIQQMLEMVNNDLFNDMDSIDDEGRTTMLAQYGHDRIFNVQHVIICLLHLKNDVITFDHNTKNKETYHLI